MDESMDESSHFCQRAPVSRWMKWKKNRSEEHTSELQSRVDLVCRLLLEKKKENQNRQMVVDRLPRKAPRVPARLDVALARVNPELVERSVHVLAVEFGMDDAAARDHHLD